MFKVIVKAQMSAVLEPTLNSWYYSSDSTWQCKHKVGIPLPKQAALEALS
jgi:hypothetical protein